MPPRSRALGWRPSPPDPRDHVADHKGLEPAVEVDPRPELPPVRAQGSLGSCTAHAVAAAIEYDARLAGERWGAPSRLDIYYGERTLTGTVGEDSGAPGRAGFKFAHTAGVLPERLWPYRVRRFRERPPEAPGERHRIGPYKVVPRSLHAFRAVLSNHQTIAFGFYAHESFLGDEVAATGVLAAPRRGERRVGGHEVLAIGYLAAHPDHVLCRNSWGPRWGLGGYFLMPWAMLLDEETSIEFRTIRRPPASGGGSPRGSSAAPPRRARLGRAATG